MAVAVVMAIVRPIPHGHSYGLAIRVTSVIVAAWFIIQHRPRWLERKCFLLPLVALGLYFAVSRPLTINPDSEIVAVYRDVLGALESAKNPYNCGCITHFDEHGERKFGNFNYPPSEIWPYWLAYKVVGDWNWIVLVVTLAVIQLAACLVLSRTFPEARITTIGAFFPLLIFFELRTNVAVTFLLVALLVLVLRRQTQKKRAWQEPAIWFLLGLGLVAKFLMIPIYAAYLWHRVDFKRPEQLWRVGLSAVMPLLVALAMMAPFGITQVFRETVLFNLFLDQRAPLTTFYPNVLSGPLTWLGIPGAYSALAVLFLGGGVLVAKWMSVLPAMLCSCAVFLLVSPTPEPQYIPVIVYLALAVLLERNCQESSELSHTAFTAGSRPNLAAAETRTENGPHKKASAA